MPIEFFCILCGSKRSILVQVGVRHDAGVEVHRCESCTLVSLWPRANDEELTEWYSEAYRKDYCEPPVEERYRLDLDEARLRVRRLLPLLNPDSSILEIGSASGAFLDAVRPYCRKAIGVEPDVAARKWIESSLNVSVLGNLDDVLAQDNRFSLVAMFHVLEHVADPVGFLRKVAGVMKPDGSLIVEVPNVTDALVEIYRVPAYLKFYYQKAHLYYFSRATLTRTLKDADFDPVVQGLQRYDLGNHIHWMLDGKPGGQGYYKDVLLTSSSAVYGEALIQTGHSDTLWCTARLKS